MRESYVPNAITVIRRVVPRPAWRLLPWEYAGPG
jgi:hypothetical protein